MIHGQTPSDESGQTQSHRVILMCRSTWQASKPCDASDAYLQCALGLYRARRALHEYVILPEHVQSGGESEHSGSVPSATTDVN